MTSDRPYRAAMEPDEAKDELRRCSGTQFDPAVTEAIELALSLRTPDAPGFVA